LVSVPVSGFEEDDEEGGEDEDYSCDPTWMSARIYLARRSKEVVSRMKGGRYLREYDGQCQLYEEYSPMTAPILTPPPHPSARVASLTAVPSFPSPCGAPLEVDLYACTVTALN